MTLLQFPVLAKRRGRSRRPHSGPAAKVCLIPISHHRIVVASIAREMRRQPTEAQAEQELVDFLCCEAGRLADFGVSDAEAEGVLRSFASAVWAIVQADRETEVVA